MFSKEKDTPCRICMAIRIFLLSRFDFGRRVGLFCTFEIRV